MRILGVALEYLATAHRFSQSAKQIRLGNPQFACFAIAAEKFIYRKHRAITVSARIAEKPRELRA